MADSKTIDVIKQIHATPYKAVLYVTGGAMQGVSWMLTTPGASRTVLESKVPYAGTSMAEAMGHPVETYACVEVADDLAKAAYRQAANLATIESPIIGVGCTCALATDREKKGVHKVAQPGACDSHACACAWHCCCCLMVSARFSALELLRGMQAFVATHNGLVTCTFSITLAKGVRGRLEEDTVASKLLVNATAQACGLGRTANADLGLRQSEHVQEDTTELADPLEELLAGNISTVEFSHGFVVVNAPRRGRVYMSGSFNPLHEGHRGMLAAGLAARSKKAHSGVQEGLYELTVRNADKGSLALADVQKRLRQFKEQGLAVVLTQAPLYPTKARLFPGSTFVIGYDTAIRLVDGKYYGGDDAALLQIAAMKQSGCSILVAGRVADDGTFMTLADIELPKLMQEQALFESIPEETFRADISSTLLRSRENTVDEGS
eukprot:jgi/Astpho2/5367/fgenesh1_pg.00075_%23_41_t